MSRSRDLGDVGSKANFLDNVSTDLGDFSGQSIPHIIPGILHPAVEGKDLAGVAFSGSYVYGTAHTDGRKYYYTDIKGSKPIKDPRIGGHFGSQRHKFKSLQLLEQETATHGENVFSIDGREWCRIYGVPNSIVTNGNWGNFLELSTAFTLEITGYFNNFNLIVGTWTNRFDDIDITINGGTTREGHTTILGRASVGNPLYGRYVDAGSVLPISDGSTTGNNLISDLGTTPKIQTIKIVATNITSEYGGLYGCELIAQDTTSTANRSKIQIPSQNVVSYGKKFNVSGTPHYDPFSAKTDGSAWTSPTSGANNANSSASWPTNIDTATSLGLDKWVDGSNYYRPYNGARVVHWVDSSGTIKTSVTVMPPNAKSIADSSSLTNGTAKANASASNDTFYPTFEAHTTDVNEDNLHEVAKTFRWREFGNGSANAGTNAGSYQDFSMLSGTSGQDNAYVMDDGLTTLAGKTIEINSNGLGDNLGLKNSDAFIYLTFIGTGITISDYNGNLRTFAQNLPYGTHIVFQDHDGSNVDWFIDGVQLLEGDSGDTALTVRDITYHQPKRPPIPEDACVIADYMLMADFVAIANDGPQYISKGVRLSATSRDAFFDTDGGSTWNTANVDPLGGLGGMNVNTNGSDNDQTYFISEFFGLNAVYRMYDTPNRVGTTQVRTGSGSFTSVTPTKTGSGYGAFAKGLTPTSLGSNATKIFGASSQYFTPVAMEFATPIHTSHHYQPFETPFLHELVGGDRNMEQTNLVCTPDGRTWDQISRNTSYLGNAVISASRDGGHITSDGNYIFDYLRGRASTYHQNYYNKDFAIAYDRFICLVDGTYNIDFYVRGATDNQRRMGYIFVNSTYELFMETVSQSSEKGHIAGNITINLKRGDTFHIYRDAGDWVGTVLNEARLHVTRV